MSDDPQDPTQTQADDGQSQDPQEQPPAQEPTPTEEPAPAEPTPTETPAPVEPESPTPESGLETPLPDQPILHSDDPQDEAIESAVSAPRLSAQQFEDQKQRDLNEARRVHAQRTGGGTVRENELVEARQDHNERVSTTLDTTRGRKVG